MRSGVAMLHCIEGGQYMANAVVRAYAAANAIFAILKYSRAQERNVK
jgi:hypothetical protein